MNKIPSSPHPLTNLLHAKNICITIYSRIQHTSYDYRTYNKHTKQTNKGKLTINNDI